MPPWPPRAEFRPSLRISEVSRILSTVDARVSTGARDLAIQLDTFRAVGCEKVFRDKEGVRCRPGARAVARIRKREGREGGFNDRTCASIASCPSRALLCGRT